MKSTSIKPEDIYQEQTLLQAIKGRRSFVTLRLTMGETPHDQGLPTPDVVGLSVQVGSRVYDLKLDKLWSRSAKKKHYAEAIEALDAFTAKVKTALNEALAFDPDPSAEP